MPSILSTRAANAATHVVDPNARLVIDELIKAIQNIVSNPQIVSRIHILDRVNGTMDPAVTADNDMLVDRETGQMYLFRDEKPTDEKLLPIGPQLFEVQAQGPPITVQRADTDLVKKYGHTYDYVDVNGSAPANGAGVQAQFQRDKTDGAVRLFGLT